jgi:protein ImuB
MKRRIPPVSPLSKRGEERKDGLQVKETAKQYGTPSIAEPSQHSSHPPFNEEGKEGARAAERKKDIVAAGDTAPPSLWLALHLPALPLEVFTRAEGTQRPLAVSDIQARHPSILVASPSARRQGVLPGMPIGAAQALATELQLLARAPEREQAALEGLAAWSLQFTSLVSLVPPDTLLLEIGGSLGLFGGPRALLQSVREGVLHLGYRARLAAAPTPLGALWLARAGEGPQITDQARLRSALSGLPLNALRLEPGVEDSLHGMGLRSLGELLRLPRDGLSRRFGTALLHSLDQALGHHPDPRLPYVPAPRFSSRLALPAEVHDTHALLFGMRRLLEELAGTLRAHDAGVQHMTWSLHHAEGKATTVTLGLVAPNRNPGHLFALLRERMERVCLRAPVREIALSTDALLALEARASDLFGDAPQQASRDWQTVIERLRARLGPEAVTGLRLISEHRPERSWRSCSPGEHHPAVHFPQRPLWLLQRPLALQSVDGRPRLGGNRLLLGEPERIESGWWDGADAARDYFVARSPDGNRLWVYRERRGEPRWFLHGIFA